MLKFWIKSWTIRTWSSFKTLTSIWTRISPTTSSCPGTSTQKFCVTFLIPKLGTITTKSFTSFSRTFTKNILIPTRLFNVTFRRSIWILIETVILPIRSVASSGTFWIFSQSFIHTLYTSQTSFTFFEFPGIQISKIWTFTLP